MTRPCFRVRNVTKPIIFGRFITSKANQMKKLLVILAVALIVAACNDNGGADETPAADSTTLPSTVSPADTSTVPVDTPVRPADTVIKK
jgi:hypothetical protein